MKLPGGIDSARQIFQRLAVTQQLFVSVAEVLAPPFVFPAETLFSKRRQSRAPLARWRRAFRAARKARRPSPRAFENRKNASRTGWPRRALAGRAWAQVVEMLGVAGSFLALKSGSLRFEFRWCHRRTDDWARCEPSASMEMWGMQTGSGFEFGPFFTIGAG